ncbi:MAG: LamG domain-containing protein [Candidatus Niyogibacteria bacterium]|nr:LamG domain-containing protein [Candidatus Niyogibacteria bacterium]
MTMVTVTQRKIMVASAIGIFFVLGLASVQVQAAANDSSITLKKDAATGLFVLTLRDPDGILEFSLTPPGKLPYGGGMSGCQRSFSNNTASFADPGDFTPVMTARVVDCKNNTTELEIPPPVDGVTKSIAIAKEEPPPPPPPPPPKEVKQGASLSAENIQYPVSELGGCKSETECRSYCDIVDNASACFTFAKKYHLISEEEAKKAADQFLNVTNGPGGCDSGKSCEDYCSTVDHLDECIAFAEKTGYYSPEQLAEARKFQALVRAGAQFPGGCKDRNTCEVYCSDSGHMEECLDFAEKSGFMPPDEIAEARKFMTLMRQGESPGGCTSKEQCENYCFAEGHMEECIAFAEKAGVMSSDEAAMARKVGGKGPGGCRSKAQCDTYCQVNGEECFRFAQDHGLISERDLEQMREGMARFKENLDKMPPEAVACMKDAAGEENFNKMLAGEPVFDRGLEGKMKSCFGQVTAQFGQQLGNIPPKAAECIKDAIGEDGLQKLQRGEPDENLDFGSLEACFQQLQASFGGGGNFGNGGFSGPGGCTNTAECTKFCTANPQECRGFGPPSGGKDYQQQSQPSGSEPLSSGAVSRPASSDSSLPILPDSGPYAYKAPTKPQSCVADSFGLVSWWNGFQENSTGAAPQTALDISDGNHGTMFSPFGFATFTATGKDTFSFVGKSGHSIIVTTNRANLNFGTGPFSLEARFKWESGSESSVNDIIRKSKSNTGAGYWLRINQNTKLLEFFAGSTSDAPDAPKGLIETPVNPEIWYHAIATRDGSGTMKLYVDGELKGTVKAPNAPTTSENLFVIGGSGGSDVAGSGGTFKGLIDEVSVYDKALSTSEVESIFNLGDNGKCTRQVEYPSDSFQAKAAYREQQGTYQAYLIKQNKKESCTENEYWDGASCRLKNIPENLTPDNLLKYKVIPTGCTNEKECQTYCAQNTQSNTGEDWAV